MFLLLVVCFIIVMVIWGLAMFGAVDLGPKRDRLAFIAVLLLGLIVILAGTGVVVYEHTESAHTH